MKVKEVMTKTVETIRSDATLKDAAQKMKQHNVGALPVLDNGKMIGMVTDRDIVVRAAAEGREPAKTAVRDAMSAGTVCCFEDQEVPEAAHLMEQKKVRRLAVLNRDKKPVGILSLGDLARNAKDRQLSGEVLEHVSM